MHMWYIHTYGCQNMCIYGHTYKNACPCMSAFIHVYLCALIHTCMYISMYNMCMHVLICICLYTDLCMSAYKLS